MKLQENHINQLKELALRLLDQRNAKILVSPLANESGYWFGGGNIIQEEDGRILICGRYRNAGDSTTGVGAGERGLEFAIFAGEDPNSKFSKILSFSKSDLAHSSGIVSIEGGCLLQNLEDGSIELFISTEKEIAYPKQLINFQKPGTGVWSIDLFKGGKAEDIDLSTAKTILSTEESNSLHLKDPVAFKTQASGTNLIYCNHPFSWSSSNTGLACRKPNESDFNIISNSILQRGNSWDVACSRITERLTVPKIGNFSDLDDISIYFYDGAECLRSLEQNPEAARRPRGYSCEELGGLAWGWDHEFPKIHPISTEFPLFISPNGTGCSRYVSSIFLQDGSLLASWQQAQKDGSQPLVFNTINHNEVARLLGK